MLVYSLAISCSGVISNFSAYFKNCNSRSSFEEKCLTPTLGNDKMRRPSWKEKENRCKYILCRYAIALGCHYKSKFVFKWEQMNNTAFAFRDCSIHSIVTRCTESKII